MVTGGAATPAGPAGSAALRNVIRSIPDFPKEGIVFRDITTLLRDPASLRSAADLLADHFRGTGASKVVSIEARGFTFGAILAYLLGAGFVPVRKKGKLPHATIEEQYELEYGSAIIEMHKDGIAAGEKVLIVDDLLATGGTASAAGRLVERLGGSVAGYGFLIELSALRGRARLGGSDVYSVIMYE